MFEQTVFQLGQFSGIIYSNKTWTGTVKSEILPRRNEHGIYYNYLLNNRSNHYHLPPEQNVNNDSSIFVKSLTIL